MGSSESEVSQWFALRAKTRLEKAVAASLRGKGYEEFLPLYRTKRKWSDRVKQVDLPLFSGYVFARFDAEHRLPVLTIPGVLDVVRNGRAPQPVEESELDAVRAVLQSGRPAKPWPFIKNGQRIRIDSGPLQGLSGILVDVRKTQRLVVSVTLLQRSVAVEIDRDAITPIHVSAANG